jgi:hypothetical protein
LAVPIRNALIGSEPITSMLATYLDGPAIFTRRPAPAGAQYPMIVVSGNVRKTDADGINDSRPIVGRDIGVYALNDNAASYRAVETIGEMIYTMFHHERTSLPIEQFEEGGCIPNGWNVVDIHCTGPIIAPVEDDQFVAKVVSLTIYLANPGR